MTNAEERLCTALKIAVEMMEAARRSQVATEAVAVLAGDHATEMSAKVQMQILDTKLWQIAHALKP